MHRSRSELIPQITGVSLRTGYLAVPYPIFEKLRDRVFAWIEAPDLRADIGSWRWFRGPAIFIGLCAAALALWSDFSVSEEPIVPPIKSDIGGAYHSRVIAQPDHEAAPIHTNGAPLRIRGVVGSSLYRSARAAGAPPSVVKAYLTALSQQVHIGRDVRAEDRFDIILSPQRPVAGGGQARKLLYAGLDRVVGKSIQLMRWGKSGQFYEASGVGKQRGGMAAPVPGQVTSSYGMRRHPILGYRRMHKGMDFSASYGTPIIAVADGRVTGARWMGGCGKAVRLRHNGGLETRYCHMSRIAASSGQSVKRGQVIGYVGSSGLSTGAHLHYETYRNGRVVNPATVSFITRAQLSGKELQRFRDTLRQLKTIEVKAAP